MPFPEEISKKFSGMIDKENELLENEEYLVSKLIQFVYFYLKESHGRFLFEIKNGSIVI